MAIAGIFFGSDTGNTENIAKMIQKLLGDDVAEVRMLPSAAKRTSKGLISYCWVSRPGITAKHSVTGMISSRHWKKLILTVKLWLSSVVVTRRITQSISVTPWAPSVTSLNCAARPLWVTGRQKATTLKSQKAWRTTVTLSAWLLMKIASRVTNERVAKWVEQIREEMSLDEILAI